MFQDKLTERNRRIVEITKEYFFDMLLQAQNNGIINDKNAIFESYTKPNYQYRSLNLPQIYQHILMHAKNKKSNGQGAIEAVFGSKDDKDEVKRQKWEILRHVLFDFYPKKVSLNYTNLDTLKLIIVKEFAPKPFSNNQHVGKYCRTIFNVATFLQNDTQDGSTFYDKIDVLVRKHPNDPIGIVREIKNWKINGGEKAFYNMGQALIPDFLKELGYEQFIKPDRHIVDLCKRLKLMPDDGKELSAIQALLKLASDGNVTPYCIDKLLYLIGSGNFYKQGDEKIDEYFTASNEQRKKDFENYLEVRLVREGLR